MFIISLLQYVTDYLNAEFAKLEKVVMIYTFKHPCSR